MNKVVPQTNNDEIDLTCPITLELFRDPVLATDGHVYEREAITRWILEYGTSPLTRESLQVNDLQPDYNLMCLARQKRHSTVLFKTSSNTLVLPPLRVMHKHSLIVDTTPNNIRSETINTQYTPTPYVQRCPSYRELTLKQRFLLYLIVFFVVFTTLYGIILGVFLRPLDDYYPYKVNSSYINSLTSNSPVYVRPGQSNGSYHYRVLTLVVMSNGYYQFNIVSEICMNGYLYRESFDPTNTRMNSSSIQTYPYGPFPFGKYLSRGVYFLVVTTFFDHAIGSFSIFVRGLNLIDIQ